MANASVAGKTIGEINAEINAEESATDVKIQLEKLSQDVAALTQSIAALGSATVQAAGEKANKLSADVVDASAQAYYSARGSVLSVEQDLEAHIRSRPLQSVAIAAGIGFIAALLTRR